MIEKLTHIFFTINLFIFLLLPNLLNAQNALAIGSWEQLKADTEKTGKPEWQEMLQYVAALHQKSTHPAQFPFLYDWEEIGPGYSYGPAFGHWDIVHQSIDVMHSFPKHSLEQLINNMAAREVTGLIPGSIWMPGSNMAKNNICHLEQFFRRTSSGMGYGSK